MLMNKQQQRVVDHPGGPLLVLACPGSGKTRCITQRITRLLDEDVSPSNILAVTFTNKAAKEMAERVKDMGYGHKLTISTFHSFCVKVLRKCCQLKGYKRNFSICDDSAQKSLFTKIVKGKGLNPKDWKYNPRYLISMLEGKKNQLLGDEEFELHLKEEYVEIFREYQKTLKMSNTMDFGDLIYNVVKIFEENPRVRDGYAIKFEHLLVDEMQDTNKAQLELVKHLASYHNNVIAVGDICQCFPAGTMIDTPNGPKAIETFKKGDIVNTINKPGSVGVSKVTDVISKYQTNKMVRVVLEDGSNFLCTENHLIPMKVEIEGPYFVYLMYKRELGFRVGMCKTSRQDGYAGRLSQESGDAIWVVDTAEDYSDASIKEQFYSAKYGIPTILFHGKGRKLAVSEDQIKWLFSNVRTRDAGRRLLADKGLDAEIPHHMPRMNQAKKGRLTLNISLCADRGMHRYSICTNNKTVLEEFGKPRKSKFKNWRIENSTKSPEFINSIVLKAKEKFGHKLNVWMSIKADGGKPLRCQPASNLISGSIIYRVVNGEVTRQKVKNVAKLMGSSEVYDLNVECTHNYIANGVVVHNSIYGWRGACIDNIVKFEEHFKDAQTAYLGINYRSTPEILSVAEKLIKQNKGNLKVKLEAKRNSNNEAPSYNVYKQPENEAEGIAKKIQDLKWKGYDYKNMAILCRVNALTRTFEETFRRREIPYVLIGTFGFYDRKEVKDSIAFMKFLANPEDAISFEQIINVPSRGVGPATLIKILEYASDNGLSFTQACKDASNIKGVRKKAASALNHFVHVLEGFDKRDPYDSLVKIFEDSGFLDHFRATDQSRNENREDNVLEFLRGFYGYCKRTAKPSVAQYLQEVMLMTSADKDTQEDSVRIMTCHAAKGLEFDVVFIPGMEEDMFPHKRSVAENNVAEERRVAYVAVTRARYQLHLSGSQIRVGDGAPLRTIPSRFLVDMGIIDKEDWELNLEK